MWLRLRLLWRCVRRRRRLLPIRRGQGHARHRSIARREYWRRLPIGVVLGVQLWERVWIDLRRHGVWRVWVLRRIRHVRVLRRLRHPP